ncbi:hypothetical protein N599_24765, partial [Saccharopolyspora erythraea D]|uniref:hypothetical protein n=1 Tax=Saccharopolyspora erythraea TaxID=1836 RepID=UPI00038CD4E3
VEQVRQAGSFGDELEQALEAFEAYLAETAPSGRRHAEPDVHSEKFYELRMEVIRRAEALPRAVWPRPTCEHCAGQREVQAVQARYPDGAGSPEFDSVRRMCPDCWGTGLALNSSHGT